MDLQIRHGQRRQQTQKPIRVRADAAVSPIPVRLIGLCERKTSGLSRPSPDSPDSVIAQHLISLFFLQSVNMSYDSFNLIVSELPRIRGHFALSALSYFEEVIV
jgi:hypothetical protein